MEGILEKAIANLQNEFPGEANTGELLDRVQEILPLENTEYKIVDVKGTSNNFKANIKVDFKNEEEMDLFVRNYCYKNNETLRILRTRKSENKTAKTVLTKYFRCHHNTRYDATKLPDQVLASKPTKRFKNTNCPFSLIVRIGQNMEDEDFSASIDIERSHNHSVDSLHSLSFKDIPALIVEKIKEFFARGLLPAAAYRELLRQLRSESKDDLDYHKKLSDRSQAPRRKDFNDIYTEFKKEQFGCESLSTMFSALEERIKRLKEKDEDYVLTFQKFDETIDQPFILVIITPLMKRVHKLVVQSKDLVFLDSSSNMEEYNLRVFIMVTHSVCGALPLGIIVTSDEKKPTLVDALELYKSATYNFGFYGATASGPQVFMTDNCYELREALKEVWPEATTLLCIFHVLQQVWRWLHEKKNAISMNDRPHLFSLFKRILYAESEEDKNDLYESFLSNEIVLKYPNFSTYIQGVYEDCESWALCYRVNLPLRGNNTNNYCEAQFLVIKDEVLNRQKEVNVVGLLDKLTTEFDQHYHNKLLSVASGKFDGVYSSRFKGSKKKKEGVGFQIPTVADQKLAIENTTKVGENLFVVPSMSNQGESYLVDMNTGFCQCKIGINGSPCKHQYLLWVNKVSTSINFLPLFSKEQKQMYAEIAIGKSLPLINLYEGLHDQIVSLPAVNQQSHSLELPLDDADESLCIPSVILPDRNKQQDLVTVEECSTALDQMVGSLKKKLVGSDQNFLRGVLKFADRAQNMQNSKLATCFHSFGASGVYNARQTTTSIVKKARKGKIPVQPTAVARRKVVNGTRRRQPQGQTKINNPFKPVAGKAKRTHHLACIVSNNEPVAKKAGRNMATKTRLYEQK